MARDGDGSREAIDQRNREAEPIEAQESKSPPTLLGFVVSWIAGTLLFVPLWAGLNFVFGTALDGPIGAFVMESPCQRLAGTSEPLKRYSLGAGRVRVSSSVCHFGSGPVRVDGPTDGLGFTGRELVYLVIGFAGYAACFAAAMALTVSTVRTGWRLVVRRGSRQRRTSGRDV